MRQIRTIAIAMNLALPEADLQHCHNLSVLQKGEAKRERSLFGSLCLGFGHFLVIIFLYLVAFEPLPFCVPPFAA